MKIPLLADKSGKISREYGVYIEEEGITFRGLFIIDTKGNLRQITINDLPVSQNTHAIRFLILISIIVIQVGRSVDETLRLVQAFQFTDEHGEGEQVYIYSLEI